MADGSNEHNNNGYLEFLSLEAVAANFSASPDLFLRAIASSVKNSPVLSN